MSLGISIDVGLSARMYAAVVAPSFVPNVLTASSFWTGTADTGLNGAGAATESATLNGTGWPFKSILMTTLEPMALIESDSHYFLIDGGLDPVNGGAVTFEVFYEGATATFTQADYQWDASIGCFGVPISLRPKSGQSGVARVRIKSRTVNGYERMMTYDVWHNRPITTGYIDRTSVAIAKYVSGADYNGSGAAGSDANAGTQAAPYLTLNKALENMTAATGRNGGVVFVKGAIYQDADGIASRNTNTLPITVMPWPGYTREQTLITKTSRVTNATPRNGGVEWNCNYVIFNNIQFDPDTVMRYTMGSNPLCVMGIDNCRGLGTLDGGLDIYGVPKGLVAAINGVNSQQMFSAAQGQKNWMRNSIWTGVSVTGITLGVNNTCYFGWDAVFFEATVSDIGFWNHKVKQTAKSVARFHYDEELTVAATPTLDAQGWTQIKVTASSSTLISNLFESYVKFLTGTLSAQPEYGKSTVTASWSFAGTAAGTCAIIAGALSGGFPNLDTVYIKGDLTASIAAGDKLRVYNYNHADSFQTASTAITTTSQTRNVYAQAYQAIGVEIQGMLLQSGSGAGLGTISTVGTAATLTTTQSLIAGQVIQLDSGTQRYEWALVVSGSGTSYVLDRAFSADQLAGNAITFRVGNTLTDLLWKNCVLDKTDGTTPQTQWQHGLKNATFLNTVFKGTNYDSGSNNGMFFSTNSSANPFTASGFGLAGINIRQSILHFLTASSQVTFATTFTPAKGINIDRNHFILGTVRGTNATGPLDPVFNATGEFGSGYKATAGGVQTVDTAHVKWDMRGNLRTVGAPVGPVSV